MTVLFHLQLFPPPLSSALFASRSSSPFSRLLSSSVSFVHFGHATPYSLSACPFPLARRRCRLSVFISLDFKCPESNRIVFRPSVWLSVCSVSHPSTTHLLSLPLSVPLLFVLAPRLSASVIRAPFSLPLPFVNPIRKTAFFSFQHLIPRKIKK